jgi:alpha-mannosidase
MEPADLLKGSTGCKDKGRVNVGLHLFGHGDGGGGPTPAMLENFRILQNTAGLPKVHFFDAAKPDLTFFGQLTMATPEQFFHKIETKQDQLNVWVGELYLELHRGTYTTHAATKLGAKVLRVIFLRASNSCDLRTGDRRGTALLQAIEVAWVMADMQQPKAYPLEKLSELWKLLLLNQFHDVLPV